MFNEFKQQYQELKKAKPGHRFQELHERQSKQNPARKPIIFVLAGLCLVAGLTLMVLPGPGIPLLIVGLALIAQEMPIVARGLDSIELKVRGIQKGKRAL